MDFREAAKIVGEPIRLDFRVETGKCPHCKVPIVVPLPVRAYHCHECSKPITTDDVRRIFIKRVK